MDFLEIANLRQSCRSYDPEREVEQEKLDAILQAVQLSERVVHIGYGLYCDSRSVYVALVSVRDSNRHIL